MRAIVAKILCGPQEMDYRMGWPCIDRAEQLRLTGKSCLKVQPAATCAKILIVNQEEIKCHQ